MYQYGFKPVRVIDGDTFVADVDLGFGLTKRITVRLFGVDCPETRGPAREAGLRAKGFTEYQLSQAGDFILDSQRYDDFGRALGDVTLPSSRRLTSVLMEAGHAFAWTAERTAEVLGTGSAV